jgi:exonuclease III
MKQLLAVIILLFSLNFGFAQSIDDLSFGEDNTLEVVTWNIEHFPKNGSTTINYVSQIIENLDVDIIALQEISDESSFNQLVNSLSGYDSYADISEYGGLAYIYKTGSFDLKDIYEIYTTSPYWSAFPRSPMVMEISYNNEDYVIINNHLKCCGDGTMDLGDSNDEETRRYNANNLLEQYISSNFSNKKVIVVGDYNDEITDSYSNNVFRVFNNDSDNYMFADIDIAEGGSSNWSYPNWPSHLDHILITNELFNNVVTTETILVDDYLSGGFSTYDYNISDHRPVAIKISAYPTSIKEDAVKKIDFSFFPNPVRNEATFCINTDMEASELVIYNIQGEKVFSRTIEKGEMKINWTTVNVSNGLYFVKIFSDRKVLAKQKIIVLN